jgi:wyosine [tRNA(Phe)-imidazoG37] synthetase (radical SAM superfamily)
MQTLLQNKNKILEIKRKVENKDKSLYNHIEIKNILITNKTLSIIMTACNRSKQTYFTLQSINNSSFKEIQIIIVDDSDVDPINKEEIDKEIDAMVAN